MIGNWNYGTGRRKSAVARVFIKSGKGDIIVNGKAINEYFARETSLMIVRQPLELTNHAATFDIKVNVVGGGETGQAGAVRHGITRALVMAGGDIAIGDPPPNEDAWEIKLRTFTKPASDADERMTSVRLKNCGVSTSATMAAARSAALMRLLPSASMTGDSVPSR